MCESCLFLFLHVMVMSLVDVCILLICAVECIDHNLNVLFGDKGFMCETFGSREY